MLENHTPFPPNSSLRKQPQRIFKSSSFPSFQLHQPATLAPRVVKLKYHHPPSPKEDSASGHLPQAIGEARSRPRSGVHGYVGVHRGLEGAVQDQGSVGERGKGWMMCVFERKVAKGIVVELDKDCQRPLV